MPDIYAGAPVRAADFPVAVTATDVTTQLNITTTSYTLGSPTVAVTFVAPTSGQVLLSVGLGCRDNSSTNRVHLAPQVRVGNSSGTLVLSADVATRGAGGVGEASDYQYIGRTTLLEGLTGGVTYWAGLYHKVSGGSSADITTRDITVTPVPIGGGAAGSTVLALDCPPAVQVIETTQINNPSNRSYAALTPEVGTTFVAPTSGRVLLIVGGGLGNGAGDRVLLSPQVFQGANASGTEVLSPAVPTRGFAAINNASGFHYGSRETVLEGLTPGDTYYVRVMAKVIDDSGASAVQDIGCRQVTVAPLS